MDVTRRQAIKSAAAALGAVTATALPGVARADDAPAAVRASAMRTTINNASPLLLSAVYGNTPDSLWWGNTLEGAWAAVPDDIKPYAAIELHPAKVCKPTSCIPRDTPELRAWYTHMLDEAQRMDIPVFIVIMSAGERQTVPAEWLAEQFETYSVLRGAMNIENYWIYNDDLPTNAAKYLEVCARYGGHFIWHDHENWFWQRVMSNKAFAEAAVKYSKNLVIATKNTPIRDNASTDGIVNGMWLTGICENWGASMDTWKWWEKHFTKPFDPVGTRPRDMRSYASEPEAMIACEMLNVYANGGTVYNFECAAYTFLDNDAPTPAYLDAIVPFFRFAVANPAPSRDAVLSRTKAVFWERDGGIEAVPDFYSGLNMDDESLPLYDSGRYHVLPVIMSRVDEAAIKRLFPGAAILTKKSAELARKKEYLDSLYTIASEGDAFAQRVGDSWCAYNSNANENKAQKAVLPLLVNGCLSVEATLQPHSYAIVQETPYVVMVTVQNYVTDKTAMWELEGNFDASESWKQGELDLTDWLSANYCVRPADSERRVTEFVLRGVGKERPMVDFTGDGHAFTHEESWNEAEGTFTVTLRHNGEVRILMRAKSASGE